MVRNDLHKKERDRERNAWNGATQQNQTVIRSRELPKIKDNRHEIEQKKKRKRKENGRNQLNTQNK